MTNTFHAFLTKSPLVLYHQPTWKCDCKCEFCNVWRVEKEEKTELSPEQIFQVLENSRQAGFTTYTLWGGEPLFYPGIAEIVKKAGELGFTVIMCTNGSRLEEFAQKLAPHMHYILLSLDGVGEKHDRMRRHPGLFEKALAGVEAVMKSGGERKIIIWSNLNRANRDQVLPLCKLAGELEVFIEFFPAASFLGCEDESVLQAEEREMVFQEVLELKQAGYPVTNTKYALNLMRKSGRFICNMPKVAVQVLWDGSIWPCEPRLLGEATSYGNAMDFEFNKIRANPAFQRYSRELNNCNLCLLPCVGHYADNLWLQGVRRFCNQIYYRNIYHFPKP